MGAPVSDSFTSTVDPLNPITVDFAVLSDGLQEDVTANVSEEAIPYGNYIVVQRGGGGPEHGKVKVYLPDRGEKDTLKDLARQGHVGTLSYFQGTFTVVLTAFGVTAWYPATDEWEGTLSYTADVS